MIVTGANSGLGKETVVALASAGARVVLCARDESRGAEALFEAQQRSGSDRISLEYLDLASVASITAFAERIGANHDRLDVLVNNAGLVLDQRWETAEGVELMMGVNHLGHHLLTDLLTDLLVASAPARVISISSVAHRRVGRRLTSEHLAAADSFRAFRQYGRSKLANILFTTELQRRLGPRGVTAACCHPGLVRSGFGSEGDHAVIGPIYEVFGRVLMVSSAVGARTQIGLAATDDVEPFAGRYLVRGRVHRPSRLARDRAHASWLWEESDRLLAGAGGPTTAGDGDRARPLA